MKHNILWGAAFGMLFTTILQSFIWLTSDPSPYKDVVIESVERTDDGYIVSANFIKTQCEFKRLEVFGLNTGVPIYLKWKALDGSPATNYDRSIGKQNMVILAITVDRDYDALEVRTRHDCNGKLVDKVFATINT